MRILLLGDKGNLAGAFHGLLAEHDEHELIGWDKEEVDVTDRSLLEKKIAALKPAVIINTVAYNDVDACETEAGAALAQSLNVDTVRHLGEISLEQSIALVHYSSDYVFSGDAVDGYDEASEPAPRNAYGESKAKGERELRKLSGRGLKWYVIRTARLFGPAGRGPAAKPNFFDIIDRLARQKGELSLVGDESGSFTYTKDLAQATLDLLESGDGYGFYHLVNSGQASWYEAGAYYLARRSAAVALHQVKGADFARAALRPAHSMLRNTKRPSLRSWQAAVDEYAKGA